MDDPNKTCGCGEGHLTFGACLRGKSLKIAYANSAGGSDFTTQKKWDRELDLYRSAVAQGIEPDGTTTAKVRRALDLSDKAGRPYDGATGGFKETA